MVQPKHFCSSAHRRATICPGATLAIQRTEAEIFSALAAARSQVDRCADTARQLQRSVPCANITRPFTGRDRNRSKFSRLSYRPQGIDSAGNWYSGHHKWKPQPEARSGLRMDLWSNLQS